MKLLAALAMSVFLTNVAFAKECKNGKPCGNACIAKDKECHADTGKKECKKGKACGDTCIAKDAVCHQ